MEAKVSKANPAPRNGRLAGDDARVTGWVGCDTGDSVMVKEVVSVAREPGIVARLESYWAVEALAEGFEKLGGWAVVEAKAGRELNQNGTEFVAKCSDLMQKRIEGGRGDGQLCRVGDGLGELDGEAEVFRRRVGPSLPGCEAMRPVEAGVDLGAAEGARVTFKMGAGSRREGCVRGGNGPACGADANHGGSMP